MSDDRDICERLEDPNYDGAVFLRLDAAKEITALRYYVARLEGDLASEEYQHARTKIALENAREALAKIATTQGGGDCCSVYEWFVHTKQIARAALAEKEKK